jgi:mannosylglycerate hydrolase
MTEPALLDQRQRASEETVVHVVPHTHWDREWYEPFQVFRMRLVDLVDQLLEQMDADADFRFTLDGQMATIDDYLEVRPRAEARLRQLIVEGRLAVGPWQILMDEFLSSGETMVRNLQVGSARAEELGRAMQVGYLPDMFGHVAQMPQILRRAGIEHAVVWRGIPAAIRRNSFRWSAPDGSEVRAEYLPFGYSSAAWLFIIPDRLTRMVETFIETLRPYYGDRSVLAMYGTDHMSPVRNFVALVDGVNASANHYRMQIETLADYIETAASADPPDLPRWSGELRSSAQSWVLMGVTSNRIYAKQAGGRAERLLERYAEPLQALWGTAWPQPLLAIAWRKVIDNSAHDSICTCSIDPVASQVVVRYAEAEQIARGLAERAASSVAAGVPLGSAAVLNPSPHTRSGLVELSVLVPEEWGEVSLELPDGTRVATQEMSRNQPLLWSRELRGAEIPERLRRRLHGRWIMGRYLNGYRTEVVDGVRQLTLLVDDEQIPPFLDTEELKEQIQMAVRVAPDDQWRLRIVASGRRNVEAIVPAPPLGWTSIRPVEGRGALETAVTVGPRSLGNGLVDVAVAEDGTLRIEGNGAVLEGVGRLVDGGEAGDSYNYGPPASDTLVADPLEVAVDVLAEGPVRGELAVTRTYEWPVGLVEDASAREAETASTPVTMFAELRAGEPFVRIRLDFENRSRDHRLRFHVPLARSVDRAAAEAQFAVVERGLDGEGGYGEVPLPTYAARSFVDAGGCAALVDHMTEYELLEGHELALTVLRANGFLSRNNHPYRDGPAGPQNPTPDAQCLGPWRFTFAIYPHGGDWREADVARQAEIYRHPFLTRPGTSPEISQLREEPGLSVEGEGIVLSALYRRDDWLELRLVNQHSEPRPAVVGDAIRQAREADLLGRPGGSLPVDGGTLRLDLGPAEIRTVQLKR